MFSLISARNAFFSQMFVVVVVVIVVIIVFVVGREVAKSITQLLDAELEAGPYTADPQYMENIQKAEARIEQLKLERESDSSQAEDDPEELKGVYMQLE